MNEETLRGTLSRAAHLEGASPESITRAILELGKHLDEKGREALTEEIVSAGDSPLALNAILRRFDRRPCEACGTECPRDAGYCPECGCKV